MLKILLIILFQILKLSKSKENDDDKIIDLSNYDYPKPIDTEDEYNIAILGTNDIHGSYFPLDIKFKNFTYKSGGLDYLGKYISILREEWKERFIWLDAGDQFQGGYENKLSEGSIITDFFNIMNLTAATFGNHEWDYEKKFIEPLMQKSNFNYIIGNIQNITTMEKIFLPNQKRYQIIKVGKVNVGIIGLTTIQTKSTSFSKDVKNVNFLDYTETIKEISPILRNQTDVIILLVHFGITCPKQTDDEKYTLKIIDHTITFSQCLEDEELYILLKDLPKGLIDVVVFGHTHEIYHQWLFGYPLISTINNGKYANIMYLSFKKNSNGKYEFNKDKTLIEGPIPICEKIFEKTLRCDEMSSQEIMKSGELYKYKFHNVLIEEEPKLFELTNYWEQKYIEYTSEILTSTDNLLEHTYCIENPLSNFVLDSLRIITNADIAILNSGTFKTKWNIGKISVANVYQMMPFESDVVTFKINGLNLKKLIKSIQSSKGALYPISGLKQIVFKKGNKFGLISFKIYDGYIEKEVDDNYIYTIVTNNYCYPFGGGGFKNFVKWFKGNWVNHGDIRDLMINYLKEIPSIVTDNYYDPNNPRMKYLY
jgi:2',3'-cyclic-nucleotide 2'-phosphodiesterase/3'-nucleotidase